MRCPSCAYDLAGSLDQQACPECGAPIAPGEACLALTGVPKYGGGPRWRFWAWIGVAVSSFLALQCTGILLVGNPQALGVWWLMNLVALAGMFLTGRNERRTKTTERILFTRTGCVREPWPKGKEAISWTAWSDAEGWRFRIKSFGKFWRQLTLMRVTNNVARKEFVMGFRCPERSFDAVSAALEGFTRGHPPNESQLQTLLDDAKPRSWATEPVNVSDLPPPAHPAPNLPDNRPGSRETEQD